MSQIRLHIQGSHSLGPGGQTECVDGVRLDLNFFESFLQVLLGVFPLERLGDPFIEPLKIEYRCFQSLEVREVIRGEDFPLQDREEYLNLVEPTGMYRSMDLYGIGIPLRKVKSAIDITEEIRDGLNNAQRINFYDVRNRVAVFSPTPGNFLRTKIKASRGSVIFCSRGGSRRSKGQPWNADPPGALRPPHASLIAAAMRLSSISTSPEKTSSFSIMADTTPWVPATSTHTMSPPAPPQASARPIAPARGDLGLQALDLLHHILKK
jgi:hypothetical protein